MWKRNCKFQGEDRMSKNLNCTCIIPGCEFNNRNLHADILFLKKHLHNKHGHHELVNFAFDKGLIISKEGYITHTWLVNEIAKLCSLKVN